MKRFLIIAGALAGSLLLILILGAVLLVAFVDPNDYKGRISSAVHKVTGREVQFIGDLSFTFFPWIGLEAGRMAMLNPPGFTEEYFATVERSEFSVKLLPLLQKQVRIGTLAVEDLVLNLERTKQGETNWEDLAGQGQAEQEQPGAETPPEQGAGTVDLSVEGIRIAGATIRWDDHMAGQHFTLSELDLRTGEISLGDLFQFNLACLLESSDPALAAETSMRGQIMYDPEREVLALRPVNLSISSRVEDLPAETVQADLEGFLTMDMANETFEATDILVTVLEEVKVLAEFRGESILTEPVFSGEVTLSRFNPRGVFKRLGLDAPKTSDPNALRTASANLTFSGTTDRLRFEPVQAALDETEIAGSATIETQRIPAYTFDLRVSSIDLDRYLPAAEEEPADTGDGPAEKSEPGTEDQGKQENPLAFLRDLRVDGRAEITQLTFMDLQFQNATMTVDAANGLARIDPLALELYGGSLKGNARVDATGAVSTWSTRQDLSNVQMGALVEDLLGSPLLTGTGAFETSLSGQGIETDQIMNTVDGTVEFLVRDGSIKGVNLPRLIRNARIMLTGDSPEPVPERKTDFSVLEGNLLIEDGLVRDDLALQSPLLRVEGSGTVDLPREDIDYLINASLVSSLEGQGGKTAEELRDIPVPIRITGSFDDLSFTPDMATLTRRALEQEAGQKVQEEIREKGKEVEEKLQQELQKFLPQDKGGKDENATEPALPSLEDLGGLLGGKKGE